MSLYMVRAKRVERLIVDARKRTDDARFTTEDPLRVAESVAVGFAVSYLNCENKDDEVLDESKDNVDLGVKIGRAMKDDETVFSATVTDLDGRDFHFFFIGRSEDEVFEKVRAALEDDR